MPKAKDYAGMIKPKTYEVPDEDKVVPNDPLDSDFWSDEELKFMTDLRKIEQSRMNFAEKKFYCKIAMFTYEHTNYYDYYESISSLLWNKNLDKKS